MRISIQGFGFPLTALLLDHTEWRLQLALKRTRGRIRRVVVRLGEINVSRGGEDKFCRIQVHLRQAPPVLIEDTGADLYALIDRAMERAGRSVANHVDRRDENIRLERLVLLRSLPGNTFALSMSRN